VLDEGTHLIQEKPGKTDLTIQPLSEMSNRLHEERPREVSGEQALFPHEMRRAISHCRSIRVVGTEHLP
jgi:hypothetical protein